MQPTWQQIWFATADEWQNEANYHEWSNRRYYRLRSATRIIIWGSVTYILAVGWLTIAQGMLA